jgi:hypothetical protein
MASQKMAFFFVTAVKTSNLTFLLFLSGLHEGGDHFKIWAPMRRGYLKEHYGRRL